jgi:DNA repair exonuclease SbcCD ATPase subunit
MYEQMPAFQDQDDQDASLPNLTYPRIVVGPMNSKLVAIVLTILCLLLAAGLIYRHNDANREKKKDVATIVHFSNQVVEVSGKLEEQKMVNLSLERDFATQAEELKTYSNNLASVSANFAKVQADAKTAAETAKEEVRRRDTRITELEGERESMTRKMNDLTNSISTLENQIADTQKKLDASEGDREFLLKELKRLQAEKSSLERQFNDLAVLRDQVRKLRDELSVSRRLDWIRRGLYGSLKGSELLRRSMAANAGRTNYNLDVEIRRDGGVTVLTNTPAPEPEAGTTNTTSLK